MQIIQDHSQHVRLSQRTISSIFTESYIHLHPFYIHEIPVTHNLMQVSVRDFSISNVKNIPQSKTILVVCCKKTRKAKDTQLTKNNMQWRKRHT